MEVIDEAVEESGVRGVLVGPYDLVRRHRDHDGRPAGAGIRNDPLARMGGRAGPDRVRALSQFRAARRRRGRPHEPEEDHGGLRCHRRVPAGRHPGRGRPSSARHGAGAHRRARHRHGLRVVRRGQLRYAARPRRAVRTARRGQPHRLIRSGRAAVRANGRGCLADRHVAVVHPGIRRGVLPHVSAAAAVHPEALRAAPVWAGPAADPRGYRRGPAVPPAAAGDPNADVLGLLRVPELGWHVRAARGLCQPRASPDARGRAARAAVQRRGTRRPGRRGRGPHADQASGDRSPGRSLPGRRRCRARVPGGCAVVRLGAAGLLPR